MTELSITRRATKRRHHPRTTLSAVVIVAALGAWLGACGGDNGDGTTSAGKLTAADVAKARGSLNVLGWSFYQADEQQNVGGVTAQWTPLASASEIYTKIRPKGSFDVVISGSNIMSQLLATKRLQPIPVELLRNYPNIEASIRQNPAWKGPDGKIYAVPLAVASSLTAWDSSKLREPRTMEDLLSPSYTKKLGLSDGANTIFQVAQALGIGTPGQLTHAELEEVLAYLDRLKPQIRTLYGFGEDKELFNRGDIEAAFQTYGSTFMGAKENNPVLRSNQLGSVSFVDSLSVLSDADLDVALKWIDNVLSLPAQKALAKASLATPVVEDADEALPPKLRTSSLSETIEHSPIMQPTPLDGSDGMATVDEVQEAWNNFKASLS